jgi:hypothetical protein
VSEPPYVVELAATAEQEWHRLSEGDRGEMLPWLRKLAQNPLPGGRSGVIRLRGRAVDGQPLFYSHTERFGIYHIVSEQRVFVLVIGARPSLDVTPA